MVMDGLTFLQVVLILILYFIPSFVALGHKRFGQIVVINIFLGWTIVGWVVALVWAFKRQYAEDIYDKEIASQKEEVLREWRKKGAKPERTLRKAKPKKRKPVKRKARPKKQKPAKKKVVKRKPVKRKLKPLKRKPVKRRVPPVRMTRSSTGIEYEPTTVKFKKQIVGTSKKAKPAKRKVKPVKNKPKVTPIARAGGHFCPSCGAQLFPNDKFCPECGARFHHAVK